MSGYTSDNDDDKFTPGFYGSIPLTPDNILKLIKIPKRCDEAPPVDIGLSRITELVSTSNDGKESNLSECKLPFVWKLYEMLEDVGPQGKDHIVSWTDNGNAFKVHKLKEFVTDVIPFYFKQSKYKSFQRQLNFYQFIRSSSGPNTGAYSHPKFVRGQKSLCLQMSPKNKKSKKRKEVIPSSALSIEKEENSVPSSRKNTTPEPEMVSSSSADTVNNDDDCQRPDSVSITTKQEEKEFVGSTTSITSAASETMVVAMTSSPTRRVSATEDEFSPASDDDVGAGGSTLVSATASQERQGAEVTSFVDVEPLEVRSCSLHNGDAIDLFGGRFHFVDTYI